MDKRQDEADQMIVFTVARTVPKLTEDHKFFEKQPTCLLKVLLPKDKLSKIRHLKKKKLTTEKIFGLN